ncbi:wnt inhibitory factor 1 isoform X3 [Neoarius graeffei]|uniref:wnt inhibitory factor 1 isoform X3 n=1 Tax=Neoarius graeffei TaxID=443677 RepID=UPI00298BCC12|nr:wnt inhibitory factor 1 isoform X3 [Neoarius graeffei]
MALTTLMFQLCFKIYFILILRSLLVGAAPEQRSLYMWIDARQARILLGFEEDILIVSEGKMAPFTHDFRKAQQRMPAIPVQIHHVNFTWQVTDDQEDYFYEFQSLRSFDKDIMDDPIVNVPLLGSIPHKTSVVQVGFPCRGEQDGVAAFEVTILVMDKGGNIVLRTPHNAIFFKTCQKAKCPGGCRNGGYCSERHVCECQDGFYGAYCEKGKCRQQCRNGGKCIGKNKCKCSKGYHGDLCSKAVCEPSCGAHGTCMEPNRCQCQGGWHGRHCNKRYRGGLSFLHRQTNPRPKSHTATEKETTNTNPSESNYVV